MMKGGHGQTNQLHDTNWGAPDHASHLCTTTRSRLDRSVELPVFAFQ